MAVNPKAEVVDFSKTLIGDDCVGMLAKLLWEIREICTFDQNHGHEPVVRTFMSYNAASTAWHLHEWFLKILPEERWPELFAIVGATSKKDYGVAVQRAHGTMAICRQLANAGKHVAIAHNREDVRGEVHYAELNGRIHPAVVLHWEGKSYLDYEVYVAALRWWITIYVRLGYQHAQDLLAPLTLMDIQLGDDA